VNLALLSQRWRLFERMPLEVARMEIRRRNQATLWVLALDH